MPEGDCKDGGAGVEGLGLLGRQRRRQARAYARWHMLEGHRSLPTVAAAMSLFEGEGIEAGFLAAPGAGPTVQDTAPPTLRRSIVADWDRLAGEPAPIRFRLDGGREAREGLLLPVGDERGTFAGFAVVDFSIEAAEAVLAHSVIALPAAVAAPPPRNPWHRRGAGAGPLLGGREPSLPFASRLESARTWAALASGGPVPMRASALHAAMCAAYALLLGLEVDRPAWRAAGQDAGGDDAEVIAGAIFSEAGDARRQDLAATLADGRGLGLDTASFGTLLGHGAGGRLELAAIKGQLQQQVSASPSDPDQAEDAQVCLTLCPVDHDGLMHLARSSAFRHAAPFPSWGERRAA